MAMIDLYAQFQRKFNEAAPKYTIETQFVESQELNEQFNNQVNNLMRNILDQIKSAQAIDTSWKTSMVSFTLQYKIDLVKTLKTRTKEFKKKIDGLQKKVADHFYEPRDIDEQDYQRNVCQCLESFLYKLFTILMSLENHTITKKTKAQQIIKIQKEKKQTTEKEIEIEFKPNIDPEFKAQAKFLQQQKQKDKQQLMRYFQQTYEMMDMIKMHAFMQQDVAIQFRQTNTLSLQNIKSGKRQLIKANKDEGDSGEYWMWFFITLTIMIVIIDFVKK